MTETTQLGRGHQTKKTSVLMGPYVTYTTRINEKPSHAPHSPDTSSSGKCTYPLDKYVSFDKLAPHVHAFLLEVESHIEPKSFKEAMKDKR